MIRFFSVVAVLLGALVIVWMALDFVSTDILALMVTLVIGMVYLIGCVEQYQFKWATASLASALDQASGPIYNLDRWLDQLHPTLQNAVQTRIEGERVGLPTPILTPYLVGLLVMLGLIGTFVGMVVTLQGAVVALEGSTELQAIRAGLAAPIGGLGLAFGTSVAGVAASAMLGLISTLSRRERMIETARLDRKIQTVFRDFSLVHNRKEVYKALQFQSEALPKVVEKLSDMAKQLEGMGATIGSSLTDKQDQFNSHVTETYQELAMSVHTSLKQNLLECGRAAGEGVQPIVQAAIESVNIESQQACQKLNVLAQEQMKLFTEGFNQTTHDIALAWQKGLSSNQQMCEQLIGNMEESLGNFKSEFSDASKHLVETFNALSSEWQQQQMSNDDLRTRAWGQALAQSEQQLADKLKQTTMQLCDELQRVVEYQRRSMDTLSDGFSSASSELIEQFKHMGDQTLAQQQQIREAVERSTNLWMQQSGETSSTLIADMKALFDSCDALVKSKMVSEQKWIEGQQSRIDDLTRCLTAELSTLREQEDLRGQAAVERLSMLEAKVSEHLSELGQSLEAPMSHLIEIASETPKAAAEVIAQLRSEMSKNIERDNTLLADRNELMDTLRELLTSVEQTSLKQRTSIESLARSSSEVLRDANRHFAEHVDAEIEKIKDITVQVSGGAIELSTLGETFAVAVEQFSQSNRALIDSLDRIELSLENSTTRSDEQLAYYVNQAREIIDHSMMSQKAVLDELREIRHESSELEAKV